MRYVRCPGCQVTLDLQEEWLGQRIQCGGCAGVFQAPVDAPTIAPWAITTKVDQSRRGWDDEDESDFNDLSTRELRPGGTFAILSLIFGIISLVMGIPLSFMCCPIVQTLPAVLAMIFGYMGLKTEQRSLAIVGMVLGGVAEVLSFLFVAFLSAMIASISAAVPPPPPAPPRPAMIQNTNNTKPQKPANVNSPPQKPGKMGK